jgi:hypothetical protein
MFTVATAVKRLSRPPACSIVTASPASIWSQLPARAGLGTAHEEQRFLWIQRFVKNQRRGGEAPSRRAGVGWRRPPCSTVRVRLCLFAHADNGDRTCDAREDVFDHGTTLVDHQEGRIPRDSSSSSIVRAPAAFSRPRSSCPETQMDVGPGPCPARTALRRLQMQVSESCRREGATPRLSCSSPT